MKFTPTVELSALKRICINVISICEIMEDSIMSVERIPLVRKSLSENMTEMNKRYLTLVDELEQCGTKEKERIFHD